MDGQIAAIYTTGPDSEPMVGRRAVEAVAGRGLRGDRYCDGCGHWSQVDECQVTLIQLDDLEEIAAQGLDVLDGQHRRNLVTTGISLFELTGERFTVGQAVLVYDRPRPPCRHIEAVTEPGMTAALANGRGGICARVERGGIIRVGDPIRRLPRRGPVTGLLRRALGQPPHRT